MHSMFFQFYFQTKEVKELPGCKAKLNMFDLNIYTNDQNNGL